MTESIQMKPKIKIINYIGEEEMKMNNDGLIATIKKQNKIDTVNEGLNIRIVKRIVKEKRNDKSQPRRAEREERFLIIETDEKTHDLMLKKGKLNVG